jgi:hypothetical protein
MKSLTFIFILNKNEATFTPPTQPPPPQKKTLTIPMKKISSNIQLLLQAHFPVKKY